MNSTISPHLAAGLAGTGRGVPVASCTVPACQKRGYLMGRRKVGRDLFRGLCQCVLGAAAAGTLAAGLLIAAVVLIA